MSRPDEARRRRDKDPAAGSNPLDLPGGTAPEPSKTRRKAEMHELRDIGTALALLEPATFVRLAGELELPERLVDAITDARSVTAWGGRKRALQYVGKLMREIDADPIRARLDALAHGHAEDTAHMHALERWRERLLCEPDALDALSAAHPTLDRPRFRALIAKTLKERGTSAPPRAYRELFRALKALRPSNAPQSGRPSP